MEILISNFQDTVSKNIERHTAHTIVSWPNPKQWVIVHTSDLMMIIRQSMSILSIITKEMGKLKTHSPTYCIMDNREYAYILLAHSTNYIWQAFYKLVIDGWGIPWKIALTWMSRNITDVKSTLLQVMACCHQATCHYLSQSMSPYGATRPQCVKALAPSKACQ